MTKGQITIMHQQQSLMTACSCLTFLTVAAQNGFHVSTARQHNIEFESLKYTPKHQQMKASPLPYNCRCHLVYTTTREAGLMPKIKTQTPPSSPVHLQVAYTQQYCTNTSITKVLKFLPTLKDILVLVLNVVQTSVRAVKSSAQEIPPTIMQNQVFSVVILTCFDH